MTTFEITVIALLAIITLMVIILVKTAIGGFHDVWQQLNSNGETLSDIRGDTVDIFQELNNIEDDILDDLRDIDDKLDNMLTIYYMQHNAKFNEVMIERMKQGLKDIPLYPPEFMKPPFNPTCDTTNTNKED